MRASLKRAFYALDREGNDATWWVRQAVTRSLADRGRTIRVPVRMIESITNLNRISREILQQTGKESHSAIVAEMVEICLDGGLGTSSREWERADRHACLLSLAD